jgi:catechol 2,3-dioxygenase-like lactoylglutathione lyase family enzyme
MLSNAKIISFAATKNAAAAKDFYENVLGLKLLYDDLFAIAFDANGTMLRIQKVDEHNPAQFTVLGWDVQDINKIVDGLTEKGIAFSRYEGMGQDDRNIWTAPGGAKIAWFKDPDGNTLSLTQFQK